MGRTAAPAIPGTDPSAPAHQPGGAATPDADVLKAAEGTTAVPEADRLAKLERDNAELRAMVMALGRNAAATSMPAKVELPTIESVVKQKPDIPVLTSSGWYVPPVHPTDKKA